MKRDISVIVPLFNEEANAEVLCGELKKVLASVDKTYELIFVDDGSTDASWPVLNKLYEKDNSATLKIISLSRRFGQTQALQAGLDHAQGSVCIFLDADLENDPADIPRLLDKLDEGWDLVNGWRRERKGPFFSKRLPSLAANLFIRRFSRLPLHDIGCTLKAFRRDIIKNGSLLGSMHRLFPLYFFLKGYRVTEVEVHHRQREHGRSKYGLMRIYEFLLEMFRIHFFEKHFSFPLYYFGKAALSLICLALPLGLFVIIRRVFLGGIWLSPLFFIAIILFFLGLQILFLGIVAEILVRVYLQKDKSRLYVVKECRGS